MTPPLQASLHALTMAARKAMLPQELEMHLEQITNEVQRLQERAKINDVLDELVVHAEALGANKPMRNDAGMRDLPRVELRSNPKWATGKQADLIADRAISDLETAAIMKVSGYGEASKIMRKSADFQKDCALEMAKLADSMPETH